MARSGTALVWFRQDLRLRDNPALREALQRHAAAVPVYIWSPDDEGAWPPGGATRWWLHQSLRSLAADLEARGSRLILRTGPTRATLADLVRETAATAVYFTRRYEPAARELDARVQTELGRHGVAAECVPGSLLFEPEAVETQGGRPYQVFTPFWKACLQQPEPREPEPAPSEIPGPRQAPQSRALDELGLEPILDWAAGMRKAWQPGEAGAQAQLQRFLQAALPGYATGRDRPDEAGTSRLSPHLHFGEISVRQVWHAVEARRRSGGAAHGLESYARYAAELGWREFAHHLLCHFPHTPEEPLRQEFARFPWADDRQRLRAWQRGRTGYPIVDAGMRELWHTGWMHNRVRMIAASFLVKDLLIPWQAGAAWFWDTLVDADLANNTLGWQWTAGCGADAAPYFRVFNPVTQGQKFDPDGAYVRRWIPELARLPTQWLHHPWEAPLSVLAAAGVALGRTYPAPLVDHAAARTAALAAFARIKP